ncbi:MAG: rod shape-determining protein [Anaerolineae bacterium]|nr:rod shape-determining protein [Anaerolineae bacterium]
MESRGGRPHLAKRIGIDLGTVNVMVHVSGKGIVLHEPSVVAISVKENKIVAIGEEAREMLGRNPESIEVARPLQDGVIADYVVTEAMLRYFLNRVCGRVRVRRPVVMLTVPVGVTSVESRAVRDAALQAGAREAHLIAEPLAAALGAGMPISTPSGNMVVDIGGGTAEAAVISLNDIVVSGSVRVGGNLVDQAIQAYIRRKYNLNIGEPTAEEIKISIGSALPPDESMSMEVKGRDQMTGLPRTIKVSSSEVTEAMAEPLAEIVAMVRSVLERTPPELASDIVDRGMVMTGGGALLRSMDQLLTQETGVPCFVADDPMACVAVGAGRALDNYAIMRRAMVLQ